MLHERQIIQNACYNTWNVHSSRKVKLAHGDKKNRQNLPGEIESRWQGEKL